MSKAFTRESDNEPDDSVPPRSSALPPGAKNFMTTDGVERMRAELGELLSTVRPQLATSADESDRKRRLQLIDQRIAQIEESLRTAIITPPPATDEERSEVRFGATVTVRRRGGDVTYRIVGVDETDLDRGWVSYLAPIAKALLGARLGERVRFRFPSGEEELEIVRIDYVPPT
jgi:transcription elongation factor GreB